MPKRNKESLQATKFIGVTHFQMTHLNCCEVVMSQYSDLSQYEDYTAPIHTAEGNGTAAAGAVKESVPLNTSGATSSATLGTLFHVWQ